MTDQWHEDGDLLDALLRRTEDKLIHPSGLRSSGVGTLAEHERIVYAVWSLVREVGSGGFDHYFNSREGDNARDALEALTKIGAREGAQALRDAMTLLDEEGPSPHGLVRREQLDRVRAAGDWEALPRNALYACTRDIMRRLADYARSHLAELLVPSAHTGATVARASELQGAELSQHPLWVQSGVLDWLWSWHGRLPVRSKDQSWLVRSAMRTASGDEIAGVLRPLASRTGLPGWDVRDAAPRMITESGALPLWIGACDDLTADELELFTSLGGPRGALFPIRAEIDAAICVDAQAIVIDGIYRLARNQPQRLPYP